MSPTTSNSSVAAKAAWDDANALAEATQAIVGGSWLASDSAAETCGTTGVRWGLARFGPGTDPATRETVVAEVEALWRKAGHMPIRKQLGGDAPGIEVRFPAVGSQQDGFFIDFNTTVHASTLQLQTPCTRGDVHALNSEKYGERHTNTPPDIPGAAPSASSGPTSGATP